MEIVIKTMLLQIVNQCRGTQDIIKKLTLCEVCGRKSGLKTVAFLLRLSIYIVDFLKSRPRTKVITESYNKLEKYCKQLQIIDFI